MKRSLWLAAVMVFGITGKSYAWRDKVESLWPEKPVVIDGRATEWSELPIVEVSGLSIHAMNDASNLYLLLRGANADGRILLSGNYRQNVTIWFLKPDHKSKAWGINLDFSQAHLSESGADHSQPREIIALSDMGITPEMVVPQGLEVSTATFPADFAFQADLSSERGRQPIYEIQIPLSMVEHKGRNVYFDLVSSEVNPQVKAELGSRSNESAGGENKGSEGSNGSGGSSPGGGPGGGGRHRRGGGGGGGGGRGGATAAEVPKPVHLQLTISLAKAPKS